MTPLFFSFFEQAHHVQDTVYTSAVSLPPPQESSLYFLGFTCLTTTLQLPCFLHQSLLDAQSMSWGRHHDTNRVAGRQAGELGGSARHQHPGMKRMDRWCGYSQAFPAWCRQASTTCLNRYNKVFWWVEHPRHAWRRNSRVKRTWTGHSRRPTYLRRSARRRACRTSSCTANTGTRRCSIIKRYWPHVVRSTLERHASAWSGVKRGATPDY